MEVLNGINPQEIFDKYREIYEVRNIYTVKEDAYEKPNFSIVVPEVYFVEYNFQLERLKAV